MSLGGDNVNESKQLSFDLNLEAVVDGNRDSPDNSDLCTICLELLLVNTGRTVVTLACNHKFHIDCIGSAFNAKNCMQCPNCMRVEPGEWRFAACNHQNSGLRDEDWFSGGEDPGFYTEMTMGMELCPYEELSRELYHFEGPNFGHNLFSLQPGGSMGGQHCVFIEYSFTLPRYSSVAGAGVAGNLNLSDHYSPIPYNQRVFWSVAEPGVLRGRHYIAHPTLYHEPRSDDSSVASLYPEVPGGNSVPHAPVPHYHRSYMSRMRNAPGSLPYPNRSTMQPIRMLPSIFDDISSPVLSRGSVFPSHREQLTSTLLPDSWSNMIGLMNWVINTGINRSNVWYAETLHELAQQFQMDRELYMMIYDDAGNGNGRRGGGGGNDRDGGGGSGGGRLVRRIGDLWSSTFGLNQVFEVEQLFQMSSEVFRNMNHGGDGNANGRGGEEGSSGSGRGGWGSGRGRRNYRNGGGNGGNDSDNGGESDSDWGISGGGRN